MHVGFIGLGLMGFPMAKNILKSGFQLSVYNRSLKKVKELVTLGAEVTQTPAELGQTCDVVISMVTGPKDVEEVFLGPNGVATDPKKGLVCIDMSTIGPTAAKDIARKLSSRAAEFVDAPVTGSIVRATSGELTIFVGGEKNIYEKIKPVLLAMGKTLHYMGPVGSGQAIKLINNYFVAVEAIALSEGMILGDTMALDRAKVAEVLQSACTGMSPIMQLVIKNYATRIYPLIFSLVNMRKDITLAYEEAGKKKVPMMRLAKDTFDDGVAAGFSAEDFSAIIKVIEEANI